MRVALTGAAGFVGTAVRGALAERGVGVNALSRRTPASPAKNEEWIYGELAETEALERLVRGADAVVHAAAWVHRDAPDPASREACFAVNLRGTERLLEVVARAGRGTPFVYVSTTSVYGDRFEDCDESSPTRPANAYGESKLAAERAVLAAHAAGTVRGVVLRPAMVYGAGAPGNIARLAAMVRRGFAPRVAGGRNAKSIVHGDDLALAILAALARVDAAAGRLFNVAGEPPLAMREVGEALATGMGRRVTWIPIPGAAWSAGAALASGLAAVRGRARGDLGRTMKVFAATTTVRAAAVRDLLGVKFRDAAEGLAESVRP